MKKNVIRLTESELKRYIGKVVAEQTANPSVPNPEEIKVKSDALRQALAGKNVQLYLDPAKTKKSHIVNITGAGASTKIVGVYYFPVKDLSFVTDTGGAADPQDGMEQIVHLRFDCTTPDEITTMGQGGKTLGVVYCPPFSEIAKKAAACTTINRTADLASAGSGVQSNMAETVRVDIG
jgi:hypothetical protein